MSTFDCWIYSLGLVRVTVIVSQKLLPPPDAAD